MKAIRYLYERFLRVQDRWGFNPSYLLPLTKRDAIAIIRQAFTLADAANWPRSGRTMRSQIAKKLSRSFSISQPKRHAPGRLKTS